MGRWYFLIGLCLVILFLILAFKYRRTLNKIHLDFITILLLLSVPIYIFKYDITFWYNYALYPATEQKIIIDNEKTIYVPLIEETILYSSYSDNRESYKTTKSFEEIIKFYKQLEDEGIITEVEANYDDLFRLGIINFKYSGKKIHITYFNFAERYNSFSMYLIE